MSDMNNITVIGRLVFDPELKYTSAGGALCVFSIAVNKKYKEKEEVSFFECVSFGKLAETIAQYCKKGARIGVTGYLTQSRWDDNGSARSKVQIVVNNFQFLDGKKNESQD